MSSFSTSLLSLSVFLMGVVVGARDSDGSGADGASRRGKLNDLCCKDLNLWSPDASPSSQQEDEIEADNSILWSTTRGQGTSFTTLNGSYRVEDYLNSTPGRPGNGNNTTPARRFPPRPSPERLANQIRNVESTQEKIVASMAENSRCLLETQEAI